LQIAKKLRHLPVLDRIGVLLERVHRINFVLRRHYLNSVADAFCGLSQKFGQSESSNSRYQQIAGDIPLGETELLCLSAIYIDEQFGHESDLLQVNVDRSRNGGTLV